MHLYLIGFIAYFLIIGLIGITAYWSNQKNKVDSDYASAILGNRSINYFLTALSANASDMSDWLFMAFPGALYAGGLIEGWIAIGLVIGMWITWKLIAPGLRKSTEKFNAFTLSTFFERRFDDKSGIIRLLSATMCLFFFSVYIAAGLKGFGYLAKSVFAIPYQYGLLIGMFCVGFYILLGGYRSLAWIDCFQALFLLVIIFLVPAIAFFKVGGWSSISNQADIKNISLHFFPDTTLGIANAILISFSWMVGYFGMPHILTKFMGIKNVNEMAKAQRISIAWQISVFSAAGFVGLVGIAYFPEALSNQELVFVEMSKTLFPPLIAGFVLSAVTGAALSVVTAQVLVMVSVLTEDFYKRTLRPTATSEELIWAYRFGILLITICSFYVSRDEATSIQHLVHYAWMGFGCSFGPVVILSLHSQVINKYGAYASILAGGLIAALWENLGKSFFAANCSLNIPAVIPGFFLSFIFAYLVSWLTTHLSRKL
jgi:sodium/proline symporter